MGWLTALGWLGLMRIDGVTVPCSVKSYVVQIA